MFIVSHFCISVILANSINCYSVAKRGIPVVSGKEVLLVGIFGLLPDILNPHLFLSDRLESWTHTLWFIFGIIAILLAAMLLGMIRNNWLSLLLVMGVGLHILCDAITGGVKLLWPIDDIYGSYLIGSPHWIMLDLLFGSMALVSWVCFRFIGWRNLTSR